MKLRTSVFLLAALLPPAVLAQPNNFELHVSGKPIGKAVYSFTTTKGGLKLASRYTYHTASHDGLRIEGDYADEFKFDSSYQYVEGTINDKNRQKSSSLLPNKTHTEMSVTSFAEGAEPTSFMPIPNNLILLPNFDPGAAQAVLLLATTHPTADSKYGILIPATASGGGGGGRGRGNASASADALTEGPEALPRGDRTYEAIWLKGTPFTGTLDGKAINVNSYMLAFGKFRWIFFADEANNLLQLNVSLLHASYIRANFALDPPKTAMPR